MEATLYPYVFNGKLKPMLVAEDGFVLGAVIHERAFYILHKRYERHIRHEYYDLHHAGKRGAYQRPAVAGAVEDRERTCEKLVKRLGYHLEKHDGKHDSQY